MKRLPIATKEQSELLDEQGAHVLGTSYWRTPEDRAGDLAFRAQQAREFVDGEHEPPEGVDRRTFMTFMGASMAMAGLAGCRRPEEKILPYAHMPEDMVPGRPTFYATSAPWGGSAVGLLVESHEGRPTKIEGNPGHPHSLGATNQYLQALVLDLYDPDRSMQPLHAGKPATWQEAEDALAALSTELRGRGGKGLAILVDEHRSPTTKRALEALVRDMPEAKVFRWEAFGLDNAREGARIALGAAHDAVIDLSVADVVLSLESDFLGCEGGSIRHSKQWSKRRRVEDGPLNRVYVAESSPSETGFAADHRLRIQSRQIAGLAQAVAAALGVEAGGAGPVDARTKAFADAVAADLQKAGARGLVVAGRKQPPAVHALAAALNEKLGAVGSTVRHVPVFEDVIGGAPALDALVKGNFETILVLGGNPVFTAPADLDLAGALKKAKTSVHLATHQDETSLACSWHVPRAHLLESWGDTAAEDGTVSIVQPLIAPMYGGKTDAELLEKLVGGTRNAYDLVRASLAGGGAMPGGAGFETAWRKAVHDGVQPAATPAAPAGDAAAAPAGAADAVAAPAAAFDGGRVTAALTALKAADGAFEVTFAPDPHAWDGRFANSGWLQELPDAISKVCWTNYASISPATAKKLGVVSGDHVTVGVGGAQVTLPAHIVFGQADDSVQITIGQGRKVVGRVGKGVGVDTTPLRRSAGLDIAGGTLAKAAGSSKLPVTQGHFALEGRPLVRSQTVAQYTKEPGWAREVVHHPPAENLFQGWEYHGHKWAMAIDLSLCTGCGVCVTACQAENNTPVIGPEGVLRNREMHWIRVDRYFEGTEEDPTSATQPMTCQHCENAPCEQVCPVNATSHSPEGINEMTYNRCIGTKYCGNNCPYKVRRFNYFNYNADIPATTRMQLNPDVTVRSRGVMEKCNFCVQRVNQAKIAAKVSEGRERLRDGEVVSACQQACPTEAIVFGDLNDGQSEVAKRVGKERSYQILRELNTRPRIHYLARISNPNPALEKA